MAERVVKRTVTRESDVVSDDDVVAVDRSPLYLVERLIWFITGIILLLLSFRFILSLLGANRNNQFADFIYDASHPLVSPFFNLFSYEVIDYGVSRFELYTLFAMLVYGVVAWLLAYMVSLPGRE